MNRHIPCYANVRDDVKSAQSLVGRAGFSLLCHNMNRQHKLSSWHDSSIDAKKNSSLWWTPIGPWLPNSADVQICERILVTSIDTGLTGTYTNTVLRSYVSRTPIPVNLR